ncbi:hypothetical protein B0H14DRAFT_3746508 [Mycena olivaceomarginata]|nr:hypothetical protein B0H14DRAFT_3746508 [Mycena olivaceomarginata]
MSKKRKQPPMDGMTHIPIRNPSAKHVHHTVTSDAGSSSHTHVLATAPRLHPLRVALNQDSRSEANANTETLSEPNVEKRKARTQNGQLLDDFGDHFDEIGKLLLDREADIDTELPCACGSGANRTTKCFDCISYPAACPDCFIRSHIHHPIHWAEVWDPLAQFFIRNDISRLGHTIQLGHNGNTCKDPTPVRIFTIADGNGVHSTKLAFCDCQEQPPNKIRQLMRSGMFPATAKDPHTAFTINMLKDFQLHNFESKKAAYDYLGAIRRLTDNSFTADVPNPYAAFLRVVRVFNFLTLRKRSGQFHGIAQPATSLFGARPAPSQPSILIRTARKLRHLNQTQRTLDGNHQCNQFSKNTDPDDVSLCAGKGYFPPESEYQEYLRAVPESTEKSTCNYLKVVNKQDKKKSKNMAITGTVNCQCSHVFILSSVDLPHAERFANADYALAMALRNRKPREKFTFKFQAEIGDLDEAATYDIAYQLQSVKKMRWGVPALHVQGHQDSCTYLFGTAYMECVGHFHGETAEHYCQLGPHVRQMNLGHRQDTIINHHGDWNHKKTMHLGMSLLVEPRKYSPKSLEAVDLAEDIQEAKRKYTEKRNHFVALSISSKDRVPEWRKMPRTSKKLGRKQVARFLESGLRIQASQRKLKNLITNTNEHELQSRRKEITTRTTKLRDQLAAFRQEQKHLMPKVADKVASQTTAAPATEDECLYLPSDFSSVERQQLELTILAVEESRWREGQVFDILRALQARAGDQILEATNRQTHHMESYHASRVAMISLNGFSTFPILTESDLFMKSVQQKRHVGDSKGTDGLLFRATALRTIGSYDKDGDIDMEDSTTSAEGSPKAPKPKTRDVPKTAPDRPEGWLWQLGKLTSMTDAEMDAWAVEGDRVQWFRAEVEMQRWQEQVEQKLAELLRMGRSFAKMQSVWSELAERQLPDQLGAAAYAHQKAAMYARRTAEVHRKLRELGYENLLERNANLVAFVDEERRKEAQLVSQACA